MLKRPLHPWQHVTQHRWQAMALKLLVGVKSMLMTAIQLVSWLKIKSNNIKVLLNFVLIKSFCSYTILARSVHHGLRSSVQVSDGQLQYIQMVSELIKQAIFFSNSALKTTNEM
jgi:hypothetical protein